MHDVYKALLAAAVVAASTSAHAALSFVSRTTSQTLVFSDNNAFSDAVGTTATTLGLTGPAGDTVTLNYLVPVGLSSFSVVSNTPDFSVNAPTLLLTGPPNNRQNFTVTNVSAFPAAGSITVAEQLGVNVTPPGAVNSFATGTAGGFHFLDEVYSPLAQQSNGNPFSFSVSIKGNYAASGTSTGQHQLISFDSTFWTIDQNFVFDGTNTVFAAHINPYVDFATTPINLEYRIFGAAVSPVPLPPSLWLMMGGLGVLGALAKRRREEG
jgi:hypothetical protein